MSDLLVLSERKQGRLLRLIVSRALIKPLNHHGKNVPSYYKSEEPQYTAWIGNALCRNSFFTVIEVNQHNLSLGILSMLSDPYNNI